MSSRTSLPWDLIHPQVTAAVSRFLHHEFGCHKPYVNLTHLTEYIVWHPDESAYPHLSNLRKEAVVLRLDKAMKQMGWEKYASGVWCVPEEVVVG